MVLVGNAVYANGKRVSTSLSFDETFEAMKLFSRPGIGCESFKVGQTRETPATSQQTGGFPIRVSLCGTSIENKTTTTCFPSTWTSLPETRKT
jgi:hypothetical protein